jgi:hypothetical protein
LGCGGAGRVEGDGAGDWPTGIPPVATAPVGGAVEGTRGADGGAAMSRVPTKASKTRMTTVVASQRSSPLAPRFGEVGAGVGAIAGFRGGSGRSGSDVEEDDGVGTFAAGASAGMSKIRPSGDCI